jgi:quinol monooxygenase YgiN
MTAMNVVHMRVKPGQEDEFVRIHQAMDSRAMPGGRNFWLVRSGERSFMVVAEWDSLAALAAARPAMVANLDKLRPIREDLGGGRGLTEPGSGEVALHMTG